MILEKDRKGLFLSLQVERSNLSLERNKIATALRPHNDGRSNSEWVR